MVKIKVRILKVKFFVVLIFFSSFSFLNVIRSTEANQNPMDIRYKLDNDLLGLENGYVYLEMNQTSVCLNVLKFDLTGLGNYGRNVLARPPSNNATAGFLSSFYCIESSVNTFASYSAIYNVNGTTINFVENETDKVIVYVSNINIASKTGQIIGEEEWTVTLEKNKNFFEIDRNFTLSKSINLTNVAVFQGFFSECYDAAILKEADDGLPMYYINATASPYIFEYADDFYGTVNDHGTGKIAQTTGLNITRLDHPMTLFNNTHWNGTVYVDFENDFPPLFVRMKEWELYDRYFQFMTTTSSNGAPTFKVGWTLSSAKKLFEAGTYFGGKLEIGFFKDGLLGEVMPFGIQNAPKWLITLQWKLYFSILISMNGKGRILPDALNYKEMYVRDAVGALIGYLYNSGARGKQFALDVLNETRKRQTIEGVIPTAFTDYVNWKSVIYTSNLDVQAWYVILAQQYYIATQDQQFLHDFAISLRRAINVLLINDKDGNYLINAFGGNASDWADTIKRTGEPLFLNSLTCWALRCMAELELASNNVSGYSFYSEWSQNLGFELNRNFSDGGLWNSSGGYYSAWRFENGTVRSYFEVDSNLLAVFTGVAPRSRQESIFHFIDGHQELEGKVPCRVLLGLYEQRDILVPEWNFPHTYHNGGYWLWISGYDVLTRAAFNQTTRAYNITRRIREVVFRNSSVYEWYDSQGFGRWNQSTCEWFSWSAGTVLYSIFQGLLGIELASNGLKILGGLPADLRDVSVRLLFRQTNFTINYSGHGSHVLKMTIDGELANSCVIPLKYYDGSSHVISVCLSENRPSDYVYLRNTSLPVASVDFSNDNCFNMTFASVNSTGEVELYIPWGDSYTVVRFENGTLRNWQKNGHVTTIVLNPLESRSIELMHGHLWSDGLVFWVSISVLIVDISFEESGSLRLYFDVKRKEPTFLAVYAPEYEVPTRVGIGGNLFTRRCENLEIFKEMNYDCWYANKTSNSLFIKTFSQGTTSIVVKWGFVFPETIPTLLFIIVCSMLIVVFFMLVRARAYGKGFLL